MPSRYSVIDKTFKNFCSTTYCLYPRERSELYAGQPSLYIVDPGVRCSCITLINVSAFLLSTGNSFSRLLSRSINPFAHMPYLGGILFSCQTTTHQFRWSHLVPLGICSARKIPRTDLGKNCPSPLPYLLKKGQNLKHISLMNTHPHSYWWSWWCSEYRDVIFWRNCTFWYSSHVDSCSASCNHQYCGCVHLVPLFSRLRCCRRQQRCS